MFPYFRKVSLLLLVASVCQLWDLSNAVIDNRLSESSVSKESRGGNARNVVIRIRNHLDVALRGGSNYVRHGKARLNPPSTIRAKTEEMCQFEKTGLTGTSGVVTYTIDGSDSVTFAIVFSVPRSAVSGSAWYGIAFIDNNRNVGYSMWDEFSTFKTFDNPKSGQKFTYAHTGTPVIVHYKDYIIKAKMTNQDKAILEVDVMKDKETKKVIQNLLDK